MGMMSLKSVLQFNNAVVIGTELGRATLLESANALKIMLAKIRLKYFPLQMQPLSFIMFCYLFSHRVL